MVAINYVVELDTQRDGLFAHQYDDITAYVLNANWQLGMFDSYDRMAQGARCTLTLDNVGGEFRQENTGAERVTNGSFASWSGDNPVGWTVTGESGTDPYVNEVGGGQGQGGAGTGMANLYTTSAALSIAQTILTPGERYLCELDVDGVYGVGGIVVKSGTTAVSPVYHLGGHKKFYFYADSTSFVIAADNGNGTVDVTIDNVSVKQVDRYAGAANKGTLIRVRATTPSAATLFVGTISDDTPEAGLYSRRTHQIVAADAFVHMLSTQFSPTLMTDVTADTAIDEIFDTAAIPWPYAHNYWLLGVEGSSELGTTTTLYQHVATSFDTGSTTFGFTGDNLDRGGGISALGFTRDLLDAEIGRFFFNPRSGTGVFTFHRRHRDILNTTVTATLTDGDWEVDGSQYGRFSDLVNHAMVNYQPREVGAAASVIWEATNLPITLGPQSQRTFVARYRHATVENARVGAQDVIPMKAGVDYVSNRQRFLSAAAEIGANSAKITLVNTHPVRTNVVSVLQLRGTPLTVFDKRIAEAKNGDSIRDNHYAPRTYDIPAITDEDYARDFATFHANRFGDPLHYFKHLTFNANKTAARASNALDRTVGDRITVTDTFTGHNQDYFIVGLNYRASMGGDNTTDVTYVLKPAEREQYWLLGVAGYSEVGQTTKLAL